MTTTTNITKILTLQKGAVRYIANLPYLLHTEYAFCIYSIVPVTCMYELRILRSFRFSSTAFREFLTRHASLQFHNKRVSTRRNPTWFLPSFRTNYKLQMLEHNLPFILNKYTAINHTL